LAPIMVKRCLQLLALGAVHCAAALGFAAPPGAAPKADSDEYQAWRAAATHALIERGDADSLATAAALSFVGSAKPKTDAAKTESAALDLAVRAGSLAPQDAAIGWLHLQLCTETADCDVRDAATTMRWVDADNGAAWLPTLAVAQRDRDGIEVDRVLADMAQGAHFNLYWNRVVVMMFDAVKRATGDLPGHVLKSDLSRLTAVTGIAGAELIPRFSPLIDACRDSAAGTERREACLKLSKIMQRGDTVIVQLTGLAIEKRLVAPDGKEARAIAERRHVLEWRVAAAAQFDTPLLPWLKNARARARLAHMRALPREEDVCLSILREHGVAIDPPEEHR
jgi:hypothetical protein